MFVVSTIWFAFLASTLTFGAFCHAVGPERERGKLPEVSMECLRALPRTMRDSLDRCKEKCKRKGKPGGEVEPVAVAAEKTEDTNNKGQSVPTEMEEN